VLLDVSSFIKDPVDIGNVCVGVVKELNCVVFCESKDPVSELKTEGPSVIFCNEILVKFEGDPGMFRDEFQSVDEVDRLEL
jgi:hypothetical protein